MEAESGGGRELGGVEFWTRGSNDPVWPGEVISVPCSVNEVQLSEMQSLYAWQI